MKKRNGFVSNSSSSSFIIAPSKVCPTCGKTSVTPEELMAGATHYQTEINWTDPQQGIEYLIWAGFDTEEDYVRVIKENPGMFCVEVDQNDEHINSRIHEMQADDMLKIVGNFHN